MEDYGLDPPLGVNIWSVTSGSIFYLFLISFIFLNILITIHETILIVYNSTLGISLTFYLVHL